RPLAHGCFRPFAGISDSRAPAEHEVLGGSDRAMRRRANVRRDGSGSGAAARREALTMTPQPKLGGKVRGFRRKEQLTQVQLAERLEISPSYLNLIEHNQRPLPAHLLVKLAQIFRVDLAAFADDSQARIADSLQEVF